MDETQVLSTPGHGPCCGRSAGRHLCTLSGTDTGLSHEAFGSELEGLVEFYPSLHLPSLG